MFIILLERVSQTNDHYVRCPGKSGILPHKDKITHDLNKISCNIHCTLPTRNINYSIFWDFPGCILTMLSYLKVKLCVSIE